MSDKREDNEAYERDLTDDFLLCNRCGTCRSVCPLFSVHREEWATARGKVELAEAFFRGEKIDTKAMQEIFDLCLHCMACEENCPSGMRANEIVMAVRAELADRGEIPRAKRMALKMLEGMDNKLFWAMRAIGLARKAPQHGVGAKSPLRFLFPLLGWPRERFVPLPKDRSFLRSGREIFRAEDLEVVLPDPEAIASGKGLPFGPFNAEKASDLAKRVIEARERNLSAGRRAYFFVGHAVNHFFPEEAEAVVTVLNLLGVTVLAPNNQVCCGAPIYYAGDIEGARRAAMEALEKFAGIRYDWIVTSCSSGGLMMKETFPRLLDLSADGYFKIEWDPEIETFRRAAGASLVRHEYPRAADLYNEYIEGKVYDINELLVGLLNLREDTSHLFESMFERPRHIADEERAGRDISGDESEDKAGRKRSVPVVTYHHPCHLKRGQGIGWEPEVILKKLPGHMYVRMPDADRCCGGGGMFTFFKSEASEAVARRKMDGVAKAKPDIVATACPLCRVQLMDMLHRRFVLEREEKGEEPLRIPVKTPAELFLEDTAPLFGIKSRNDE